MLMLIRAAVGHVTTFRRTLLSTPRNNIAPVQLCRTFSDWTKRYLRSRNSMYYLGSVGVVFFSFAVLSVPAFRMFCEKTAITGLTKVANDLERIASMGKVKDRLIRVSFNADIDSSMRWQFKPLQKEIYVCPGETALIFYSAYNPTDKSIVGISTYNVSPFQAAYYFNKIQCFCFEDQILNPGEQVELPVFFYIDPDYVNDPDLEFTDSITLSYTFFESKSGLVLPDPFDPNNQLNAKQNVSALKNKNDGSKENTTQTVDLMLTAVGKNNQKYTK